ncbi:lytic transglycosylase domain-containing protein [Streptantibioticus rubrisoli]|uniref:Lytic transglycosylase domain-containing protein n=1 Tax=Streptantibioticus rubrisoli TaxID=1387313 RepID=A0ABT1PP39_9ACTN|nr:lytic transglycosylase domain-containing protein [Streptantibioticus rubrisoli]MCQ4046035.1 lytic transglycosylase domain-containing protein [Streptantibioticus rubrisoli]
MLEGNRVSRISVRGIAVASATAVTTVGAVVGVASGSEPTAAAMQPVADTTALDNIDAGQQATVQAASLTEQAQTQQAAADAAAKQQAAEAARKQAAADAAKKKQAADAAAAKAKEQHDAQQAASRDDSRSSLSTLSSGDYSIAGIQAMAQQIIGDASQFQCFSHIVNNESGWNYQATNASSGAYGLVQALPGSKMASAGADWRTNPATQIKWGLSYMDSRYGSPCGAWDFWQANSWY